MKLKNRICSILLAVSIIFSSLGVQNIVYAESVEDSNADTVVSTSAEKISESEGKEIFNEVGYTDKETKDTEKETKDTEKETSDTEKETSDTEKETSDTEKETSDTEKETSDTEKETKDTEKETKDTEKETSDTEKETSDTEKETSDTEKETSDTDKETSDTEKETSNTDKETNGAVTSEEVQKIEETEKEKEKVGTDTIVEKENGEIDRNIKDGDFFVQIEQAIKDAAGNIFGWIDGVISGEDTGFLKDKDGEFEEDEDGDFLKYSYLDIDGKYIPISSVNEEHLGKWIAELNMNPDPYVTTYYKVTESKKYQEREILENGTEGDLLYIQEDGEPGTTVTDKPVLRERVPAEGEDGAEGLPGVIYDDTIYYLKFKGDKLVEIRMVIPGVDDPFGDLDSYKADYIKGYTDKESMKDSETSMDFFIEYLEKKGIYKVNEDKFGAAGKLHDINTPLNFENEFKIPEGEVQVEGDKNLTGKDLEEGEFEFVVKDKNGEIIGSATNGKDGNFIIDIPVDHEGEFEYTIEEVSGNNPNIIYDGTIYKAVVKVRFDRLTNTLISEVVYMDVDGNELDSDKIQFSNEYKPPTPIIPPIVTPPTTTNPGPDPEKPPTPIIPPAEEIIEEPEIVEEVEEVEIIEKVEITEEPEAVEEVVEESIIPMLPKTGIADISLFIGGGISSLAIGAYLLRKRD